MPRPFLMPHPPGSAQPRGPPLLALQLGMHFSPVLAFNRGPAVLPSAQAGNLGGSRLFPPPQLLKNRPCSDTSQSSLPFGCPLNGLQGKLPFPSPCLLSSSSLPANCCQIRIPQVHSHRALSPNPVFPTLLGPADVSQAGE